MSTVLTESNQALATHEAYRGRPALPELSTAAGRPRAYRHPELLRDEVNPATLGPLLITDSSD